MPLMPRMLHIKQETVERTLTNTLNTFGPGTRLMRYETARMKRSSQRAALG